MLNPNYTLHIDSERALRATVRRLTEELRRRDRLADQRMIDEHNAQEEIAKELADTKAREEAAAELEVHRKRAWFNDHSRIASEIAASGNDGALAVHLLKPPQEAPADGSWPPGTSADDFKSVPAWNPPEEATPPTEKTFLGRALAAAAGLPKI